MDKTQFERRKFITIGAGAVASTMLTGTVYSKELLPTAKQAEGPFFPKHKQIDKDADMTSLPGKTARANGQLLKLSGRVLDIHGNAIENALIDVWQADSKGRYLHEDAPETSPLDENFQYWAKIKSASDGSYSIKTIIPAKYAAENDWVRPPHIHFRVAKRGMRELTTQMYFAHEKALNAVDRLYLEAPVDERAGITVEVKDSHANFNLVLAKI